MKRYPLALLVAVTAALVVSGLSPYDRTTWWLEIFPILIGAPILIATHRRFPLTALLYTLLAIHAVILMVGGHYSYARVPLGYWMQNLFGFTRNNYDRIGHLAQGFIPAILAREILLRTSPLRQGKWLFVLVTATCLAFSACYEFIEWWTALAGGDSATDFLGTQGDVWDTQWDMFCALIGAITAQLLLSRVHDRALEKLPGALMPDQRILIFGNSGSGKSTRARALAAERGLVHLDLDAIVWEPGQVAVQRPAEAITASLEAFLAANASWVIEGCYGELIEAAARHCTELVFLNPGLDACLANNRRRPWEPHKYATKEQQDAMLDYLQAWVAEYYTRDGSWSYQAHRRIFDAHPGARSELTTSG